MTAESIIREASVADVPTIIGFLTDMQRELQEFDWDENVATQSVASSLNEHVHWFLFADEQGQAFGTCYLQSVHNYWRRERRYYLGAFYITPDHRKQGRFKTLNAALQQWATAHDGVQIYGHIHKDNEHSLAAFSTSGMTPTEYKLCANHWGAGGPHHSSIKDAAS